MSTERKRIKEALDKRLAALAEPPETADISFTDLFNVEEIQKIQDAFAKATNVASIITHPDGTPITRPSNFCRLCRDIIRKTEKGLANCYYSDAIIGRQNPAGPIIQPCLSGGLWDAGASITLGGKHVANWLIGQVKNEAIDEEKIIRYASEIGADQDEFRQALQEVPVMSNEQFQKVANALFLLANELSLKAYQNVQQVQFIIERKQTEKKLQRSNELLRAIIEAAPTAIIGLDLDGNVQTVWNPAAEKMLGWSAQEAMGRPLPSVSMQNQEEFRGFRERIRRGLTLDGVDVRRQRRDGSPIDYSIYASPLHDAEGRITGNIAVLVDITERKRAESQRDAILEALHLDESRLQALLTLNQMTEASLQEITGFCLEEGVRLTKSKIGYLAFMNEDETVLTIHSWSKEAMAQCATSDKPLVYPVATTGLWGEAVRQRKPIITNDYAAPNPLKKGYPPGHVRVTRHMNVPAFDGERIVAVAGVGNKEEDYDESDVRQLTLLTQGMWRLIQRRQAEGELKKYREHLEDLVQERTAALEEANAELSQYAYVVSHDLRAPLRAIHNYTDFLQEDLAGTLDGDQKTYLEGLGRVVREADVLVEDLLKLSRVGQGSIQWKTVDLGVFLRELIASLDLSAEVQVTLADDWPTLNAEPALLRQIFQNLIDNAVKFNTLPHKRVELGWRVVGEEACEIWVRDNGIGIAPRHHEQIFRLFERLHAREEYKGTGAGLAIVKKAASRLCGTVRVESEIGQGSTFFVTLPKV